MAGRMEPGHRLPTVRGLAERLVVSPATVASAYRDLKRQGLIEGQGRQGTRVAPRPPLIGGAGLVVQADRPVPAGVRDLSSGHPDSRLLPDLGPLARQAGAPAGNYDAAVNDPGLLEEAGRQFAADGIPAGHLAVVSGALDGVERVLLANLRPGDRVGVEDPGFPPLFDLLRALGLKIVPVAVDDRGPRPDGSDGLAAAIAHGIDALVITPRGQNPFGSALDVDRARRLRRLLRSPAELLIVEDDHAIPVAGAAANTLWDRHRSRWAVVRSVSKALGPDLRLAVLAGDELTVARVAGRQALGAGWVSTILQRVVAELWADPTAQRLVAGATERYAARRLHFVERLAGHGIEAHSRSGFNVWIPVMDEAGVAAALGDAGWAVATGERFRIRSGPAIRVTTAALGADDAGALANDLAMILDRSTRPRRRIRT